MPRANKPNTRSKIAEVNDVMLLAPQTPISRKRALQLAALAKSNFQISGFVYDRWADEVKQGAITEEELKWMENNLVTEVSLHARANVIDTETEIRQKIEEIKELLGEAGESYASITVAGSFVRINEHTGGNGNWYSSTMSC